MQSAAADFKYEIGTCLHEGDDEAVYETEFKGKPAVLRFVRPDNSLDAAKKIADLSSKAKAWKPGADRILDYGEAEVFETHVVYAVMGSDEEATAEQAPAAIPLYRKHAGLAIGGVVAAAALSIFLVRNAQHKPAPPAPAPAAVVRQEVAPPAPETAVKPAVRQPQARGKRLRYRQHRKPAGHQASVK